MLHDHVFLSRFPEYDRLEGILAVWPRLFADPPTPTHPAHVYEGTLFVLSCNDEWTDFLRLHAADLAEGLQAAIPEDLGVRVDRLEIVPTSATAIYLARQIVAVLDYIRDLEADD